MKNNYDAVHTGITIALKDDHKYIAPLDTSSLKKIIQFLKKFPPNTGINNATFMYRREVFKKIGYRNETATFFPHNDFEYALRTLLYCNVGVVNSSSYEYHQQVGSHSSIHGSSANAKKKFGDLTAEYLNKFNEKLLLC
jgi:GT2 family glycosyltransferase